MPLGEIASFCIGTIICTNRLSYLNRKTSFFSRIQRILKVSSERGPDPPPEEEKKENSLLTSDLEVPGRKISFKNLTAKDLENTPAIYAIRCSKNNKHYIGETKNLKNRIPRHSIALRTGNTNKELLADFEKYGKENFELIIFASGETAFDYETRWTFQRDLKNELQKFSLCYNTSFEPFRPPLVLEIPNASGLYMIRCKINDTVYIGQTGERNGLSGRWKRHKQRMNSGNGNNSFLQADWDLYGVDQFEFIVLESGIQWNDEKIRKKRETELIRDFREKGLNLYNVYESDDQKRYPSCLLSSKESCLQNQTQEFRNFISQLNTGRPNANRIAVVINNQVFLSISEAAAYLNISTKTIRLRIQSNVENFSYASPEQVNEEILARERAGIVKLEPPQNFSVQKRTSGLSKKVKIHGKVYESISEAAKALNLSPQAISKSLKKGRPGYNYLDN